MFQVTVPATTANLGPGFDVLGLALQLYDEYTFSEAEFFQYHLLGADASRYSIPSDSSNMVYQAFSHLYRVIGKNPPGVEITCHSHIPICRGLGSSAAATVAGLVGANKMAGNPLRQSEILQLATELEGHPDNVAPALFGGLVISLIGEKNQILYTRYPLATDLACILAVPDFTLETRRARGVLPQEIPFKDAIFNLSRVSLLIAALTRGDYTHLQEVMEDRLHQPYRQSLIPGFRLVKEGGLQAGAYGIAISGAGPTVLAFAPEKREEAVGNAMISGFKSAGIRATWLSTRIQNQPITI